MAARLRPSAAPRWVPCPGSVLLCEQYPESGEESVPAAEGTAAHGVASEVLSAIASSRVALSSSFLGKLAPNGVIISREMIEAVQVYIEFVLSRRPKGHAAEHLYVERHVKIHSVHPENEGTFDNASVIWDPASASARLVDFKYGWGIVEPQSWQLIDYMIGLLAEWQAQGLALPESIELCIVQPRPFHPMGPIRTWKTTPTELHTYFEKLRESANEALGPNPRCIPGDHCNATKCSGRANCNALNRAVYEIQEFVDYLQPVEMSGEALGARVHQLRKYSKLVDALSSGIEERALSQIRARKVVHGWSGQMGNGRTKWKAGAKEQVLAFGDLMGVELRKPQELITPNQAEKAGIDSTVISPYTETPTTGMKLVPMGSQEVKNAFNK